MKSSPVGFSACWQLIAGSGVSPRRFLTGKWLVAWIAPLLVLGATLIAVRTVIVVQDRFQGALFGFRSMIGLVYFVYFGVFINLSMIVSAWCRGSATAMVVLFAFWMVGGFAVPKLASNFAESLHPSPDRTVFKNSMLDLKKTGMDGDPTAEIRLANLREATLKRYGAESIESLPINLDALRIQGDEEYANKIFDRFYSDLMEAHGKQEKIYRGFAVVSLLIPARFLSMGFAGTDNAAHWRFNQEAENYRRHFVKILNDEMMHHSKTGDWGYQSKAEVWHKVPEFETESLAFGQVLNAKASHFGILLLWFFASGGVLFGSIPGCLFRS